MKTKDMLIARQELRHQDVDGVWHVVEEGERVIRAVSSSTPMSWSRFTC